MRPLMFFVFLVFFSCKQNSGGESASQAEKPTKDSIFHPSQIEEMKKERSYRIKFYRDHVLKKDKRIDFKELHSGVDFGRVPQQTYGAAYLYSMPRLLHLHLVRGVVFRDLTLNGEVYSIDPRLLGKELGQIELKDIEPFMKESNLIFSKTKKSCEGFCLLGMLVHDLVGFEKNSALKLLRKGSASYFRDFDFQRELLCLEYQKKPLENVLVVKGSQNVNGRDEYEYVFLLQVGFLNEFASKINKFCPDDSLEFDRQELLKETDVYFRLSSHELPFDIRVAPLLQRIKIKDKNQILDDTVLESAGEGI